MRKIIIFISSILFLVFIVSPIDISAELPNKPRKEPAKSQQITQTEQRGSDRLPIVVKVIPPPITDTEAAANKQERKEKQESDWWVVKITAALALIGALQLIVFGLQARRLRQTVEATQEATDAAKRNSELAREEFIATHRPKLRVHSVFLGHDDGGTWSYVQCSIDNIGESAAILKDISMELKIIGDIFPIPVPLAYGEIRLVEKTIPSGCSHTERFTPDGGISIPSPADRNRLYFFGYVDYLDSMGDIRRTAFCRQYMPETERFITLEDENCEYSY